MSTVDFTYYLHDVADGEERLSQIRASAGCTIAMDDEELGQLVGRPFYEVKLQCTLDLTTGEVTINSAST